MVNRQDRERLIAILQSYLDGEITAFKLDDELMGLSDKTHDQTVDRVAMEMWLHYDDMKDHKVMCTKEEWDLFQRYLLLLHSDAEMQFTRRRCWHGRQAVAIAAIGWFASMSVCWGLGMQTIALLVPLGVVSMLLGKWTEREERRQWEVRRTVYPFSSVGQLFALRRRLGDFRKQRYPADVGERRLRGRMMETALWLNGLALWTLFSPLMLLAQCFPKVELETSVVLA